MPGGHYDPSWADTRQAVEAELSFLRRHLLERVPAERPGPAPAQAASHSGGRA